MLMTDRRTSTVRRIMRDRNIQTGRRIIMTETQTDRRMITNR
jgi:hypothetical protein